MLITEKPYSSLKECDEGDTKRNRRCIGFQLGVTAGVINLNMVIVIWTKE